MRILSLTRKEDDLKLSNKEIEFFTFTRPNILFRVWKRLFHSYHEWPVSKPMEERVKELIQTWQPDVVHADELRMGHYLPVPVKGGPLFSICAHNVESELIKKTMAAPFPFAKKFFNRIYRKNLIRFEQRVFSRSHLRLTYSEVDKEKYHALYPHFEFNTSSNGVNLINLTEDEKKLPEKKKILFLGSLNYLPNIEGLFWFIDHMYPKMKDQIELTVAGSTPLEMVKEKLHNKNITLLDTPLDLRPVYLSNSLLIVPILSGSGTRGKILESLMYNRPVLTTTIGVEGLNFENGEGVLIADGELNYLKSLEEWLNLGQKERESIAEKGRNKVLANYTWNKVGEKLIKSWTEAKKQL